METTSELPLTIQPEEPRLFTDLAKAGKNDWWRYTLSFIVVFFGWQIIGSLPYGFYVVFGGTNLLINYLTLSFSFICFLAVTFLVTRTIHRRSILSLITTDEQIKWDRILISAGIWLVISVVITVIDDLIHPGVYQLTFDPTAWVSFAIFAIILTPIQTSAEEVFFRGYLLQSMALITRNKWVLILLSGVVFAIPHFLNPEMEMGFWILALYYFSFGVLLALVSIQSNSLELALGVHAANNLFTVLIANYSNSAVASPSIFLATTLDPTFNMISFLAGAVVYWLVIRWLKYV